MPQWKLLAAGLGGFVLFVVSTTVSASPSETATWQAGPLPRMLPAFTSTDQWGTELGSRELRGRVWIASFLTSACENPCPRVTSTLKSLQEAISAAGSQGRTRIVSFSLRPEEDTPDKLAQLAERLEVDEDHWRFVTAQPEEFIRLRNEGFRLAPGDAPHLLTLIDAAGQLRGFFDALEVCDPSIPPIVTHTGMAGIRPLWRNIDDEQVKAIAERGGTIGIIFNPFFLGPRWFGPLSLVIDHMEHIIQLVGEDFVSLGSDYDGAILLPDGFEDCTHQPKLVADMLSRGWSAERIKKILGANFLRVLKAVRP